MDYLEIDQRIRTELQRMLDGGVFSEAFWQECYGPTRQEMYRRQRERDAELGLLQADVSLLRDQALTGDVHSKRSLRKAQERVRKFQGVLRARADRRIPDMISAEWRASVQFIADGRDAACHIQRINNARSQHAKSSQ